MEQVPLKAKMREKTGKSYAKKLRRAGFVPGVVYKARESALPLEMLKTDLYRALHTAAGENVIIKLKISGGEKAKEKERTVIIKEVQHDPLKGEVLHIDFNQISLTETLKVTVPVVEKGESIGVKVDGGVLNHVVWEIEIECLPTEIPEKVDVDISELKIGDAIYVRDLSFPPDVKVLTDPEQTVISVEPPIKEVVPAVAPEEEITEPEVITEKKPAEEEVPPEEEKKEKEEKKGEKKEEEKKG